MNQKYLLQKILVIAAIVLLTSCQQEQNRMLLFVGSYTDKKPGTGIKVYDFNIKTGESQLLSEIDDVINPSFLRLSPNGQYLYSVLESQMERNGKVAAFKIDSKNGKLIYLNGQDCGGRNPVHLEVDSTGKYFSSF